MLDYILYRIGQTLALLLPTKIAYKLAIFISDLRCVFLRQDRLTVMANLKAIFPDKPDSEIERIASGVFINFAKYLVDFFCFQRIDEEYIKKNVHLVNMHYLDQALASKKGGVVVTAHLGNWELGGVIIALLGYPFWVVALSHKNKKVNNFFTSQRENKGVKVIPFANAVKQCLYSLRNNKLLALVGDRDFSENCTVINFFGRPALLPEGPAVFSYKTGALIVPGFMLRNKDDSFTLVMEEPIEYKPHDDHRKGITELMLQYIKIFERYIKSYPEQWYMFRKFWKD